MAHDMEACKANPLPNYHLGHIINAWDVHRVLRVPMLTGQGSGWAIIRPGQEAPVSWGRRTAPHPTFDAAVKASGISEWVTPQGGTYVTGTWFPASAKDAIEALPFGDAHRKVKCVGGKGCEVVPYEGSTCGRPVVGEADSQTFGSKSQHFGGSRLVPACAKHVGTQKRRDATNARYEAEAAARKERWDREEELTKASRDWAERLAREYGIDAEGDHCTTKLQVLVQPEKLYEKLVDLHGMLRDAGFTDEDLRS